MDINHADIDLPVNYFPFVLVLTALSVAAAETPQTADGSPTGSEPVVGLLVMAHGGTPEWNAAVGQAVAPLRSEMPTALALGMAEPVTLQAAMDSLMAAGVDRVAVVRLFMSGESFRHQTEYLLGLRDDPPAHPMPMRGAEHGGHEGSLRPLEHDVEVVMTDEGLMESWLAPSIIADRAAGLSRDPDRESVVLIAHGMGDEAANERVLAEMERSAAAVRDGGFKTVRVFTLREDWEEARAVAESQIRGVVLELSAQGDRVLVLPFRLSGFGPFASVLDGLEYEAGVGFLPHRLVTEWIRRSAHGLLNPPGSEG